MQVLLYSAHSLGSLLASVLCSVQRARRGGHGTRGQGQGVLPALCAGMMTTTMKEIYGD